MKNKNEPIIKRVAISIPSEGHTLPEAYDNHLLLSFHLGKFEERCKNENRPIQYQFGWYTAGRLFTAMAREKLVHEALKAEMDYIIMYDDDMLLPIDAIETLLFDMETHPEIDILAPLAFMRNAPHYPVIYTTVEGFDQETHSPYFMNEFVKKYPREKIVECDAVGFGAVCIKMDVVKKMTPHYFFSTTGTGEDIYFCMKARQEAKARVFMDTRIKLAHLSKPTIVDEDYFDKWCKDNKHDIPDIPHKYLSFDK